MKKIFAFILICLMFSMNLPLVNAEGSCPIDPTPEEFTKYLSDFRKEVNKVRTEILKNPSTNPKLAQEQKAKLQETREKIQQTLNIGSLNSESATERLKYLEGLDKELDQIIKSNSSDKEQAQKEKQRLEEIKKVLEDMSNNTEKTPEDKAKQEDAKNKLNGIESSWLKGFIFGSGYSATSQGSKLYERTKNSLWGTGKRVIDLVSNFFSFNGYWENFALSGGFWISAIMNDYFMPLPVKRDFDLVRQETRRLKNIMNNLVDSGIDITQSDKEPNQVTLSVLYQTNMLVEYAFMGAIVKGMGNGADLMPAQNAIKQAEDYIAKHNLNLDLKFLDAYTEAVAKDLCKNDTNFWDPIMEILSMEFKDVFKDWKEARRMVMGMVNGTGKEDERRILKNQLSASNTNAENYDIFLENLDNPLSLSRFNPVSNITEKQMLNLKAYFDGVANELGQIGGNLGVGGGGNGGGYATGKDVNRFDKIQLDKDALSIMINNDFQILNGLVPTAEKDQSELKKKILEAHEQLVKAVNTLYKTSKIAEKVCKAQGVGLGKCNASDYTK